MTGRAAIHRQQMEHFGISLIMQIRLLLRVRIRAINMMAFVNRTQRRTGLDDVRATRTITRIFAQHTMRARAVAHFFFPLVRYLTRAFGGNSAFHTGLLIIMGVLTTRRHIGNFISTSMARQGEHAAIFRSFEGVVIDVRACTADAFRVRSQNSTHFRTFRADSANRRHLAYRRRAFVRRLPRNNFVTFYFRDGAQRIRTSRTRIIAAVISLLTIFVFPRTRRTTTTRQNFGQANSFRCLVMIRSVQVRTLTYTLRHRLFSIMIQVTFFVIRTVTGHGRRFQRRHDFAIFAGTYSAIARSEFLGRTQFPTNTRAGAGNCGQHLAINNIRNICFMLRQLRNVMTLFGNAEIDMTFNIQSIPLFYNLTVFIMTNNSGQYRRFVSAIGNNTTVGVTNSLDGGLHDCDNYHESQLQQFGLNIPRFGTLNRRTFRIGRRTIRRQRRQQMVRVIVIGVTALVYLRRIAQRRILTYVIFDRSPNRRITLN